MSDVGTESTLPQTAFRHRDFWTALFLALAGVAVRLAFVRTFPAAAKSDSQMLVAFGRVFYDRGLFPNTQYWSHFNPGLPMILALFDGAFARNISGAARTATAVATGFLGVLPFLIWRRVLAYRWRLLAGLLLTFWPGQVFFSGIVMQDNWVLLPCIALGALAVRSQRDAADSGHPFLATSLMAVAVAIRQEMLLVLFLPWLAVAAGSPPWRRRARVNLVTASALLLSAVLALAGQRFAATGRFTIATEHGGLALLGSVAPHSFANGWIDPRDYISAVEPSLFGDPIRYRADAYRLAWAEIRRHPLFHAIRAVAQLPKLALISEADNLEWSVTLAGALPESLRARGESFRRRWDGRLKIELGLIQGFALAALLVGIGRRDRGILILASAAFVKVGLHLFLSPMPRLVVPAIGFELLMIPLAAAALASVSPPRRVALLAIAGAVPILLLCAVPPLQAAMMTFPQDIARLTAFPLAIEGGGSLECTLQSGKLVCLEPAQARLETPDPDPAPGDTARVVCRLPALAEGESLTLRLEDTYASGGWPGRMIARVWADGRPILRHDLANEPFGGWVDVPLAGPGGGGASTVTIEELAVRPDRGMSWGASAPLGFAFRRGPPARSRGDGILPRPVVGEPLENARRFAFRARGEDVQIYPRAHIVSPEAVSIGDSVIIDDFVFLVGGAETRIGSFVHLASFTSYLGRGKLVIEDFVSVSGGARLYTGIDDFSGGSLVGPGVPEPYRQPTRSFLHVGKFALVGANAVVFPGVTLGEGCAVGALSLVNADCEPWTIYGGVPARPLKKRRKERVLELEAQLRRDLYDGAGRYIPRDRR